ncbi:MAG: hypothetical protein IKU14_05735, partial [Rhodocyclaceae bacterium]|nr:hypothetical protein [Rhodocyclaceae bacterium]
IKDNTVPVIVRYGESDKWINILRDTGPKREIMRRLQRYTVSICEQWLKNLRKWGLVEELAPTCSGLYVQTMPSLYGERFGLDIERESLEPDELTY